MAITPASATSGTAGTGSLNPSATISPPSGLAAGDTWVIAAADWNGSAASWNTPTGFTKQSTSWNDGAGQNVGVTLWYKPNCTGSETSVTITETETSGLFCWISWRHSAAATSTPWVDVSDGSFSVDFTASGTTVTDQTKVAHTPTQSNEIVYLLYAEGSGGFASAGTISATTPSGFTNLLSVNSKAGGGNTGSFLAVDYAVQTTATSVPITSSTLTFPSTITTAGGVVGVVISFYAGAAGPADPFPAYVQTITPRTNPIYKM